MLAYDDPLAGRQVQRSDVPGGVTAEGELTRRLGLEQQQRHPAEHAPLEPLFQGMQPDLEVRVLPQQDVMLEVDGHLTVERHVQDRDQLALEPVAEARGCPLGDLGREDLGGGRHGPVSPLVAVPGAAGCPPPPIS